MKRLLIGTVSALALLLPSVAMAQETIKVGILVALEGAFAAGGADGVRNVELALKQVNNMAGGKKIETVVAATDTTVDTAIRQARRLIEQDKVDIILGPYSSITSCTSCRSERAMPTRPCEPFANILVAMGP